MSANYAFYVPPFDGSIYIPLDQKGTVNGVATLGSDGLIPLSQLPFASPLVYEGNWNATTNTPTLSATTGVTGSMYICSVSGTQSIGEGSKSYIVGDVLVANEDGDWIVVGSVGGTHINGTGYIKASGTSISYVSSIGDSDISSAATWNAKASTSSANTWTAAQRGTISQVSDAATITLDFATSNNFRIQLTGTPRTLGIPTNIVEGQSGVIKIWQDNTGTRTLNYAWPFVFAGGSVFTLSTGKGTSDLLSYYVSKYTTGTATISNGANAVVTMTSHNLLYGTRIQFTTTGSLPTGLSTNTVYWVNPTGVNTFNVASSLTLLQAGTYITTSSAGSGTHTVTAIAIDLFGNNNMS